MGLTIGHILYIPATMLVGLVLGWWLATRRPRAEANAEDSERARRRAGRAERMAQRRSEGAPR